MRKKYRSNAMAAIHKTMEALHDIVAIDRQTMQHFDVACLTRSLPPSRRFAGRIVSIRPKCQAIHLTRN